jgi:hypothetical protein
MVKLEINGEVFGGAAVNQKGLILSWKLVDAWEPD